MHETHVHLEASCSTYTDFAPGYVKETLYKGSDSAFYCICALDDATVVCDHPWVNHADEW